MNPSRLEFLASFLTADRLARIDEVLSRRTRFLTVGLERVHRTQNASACLRNCEAFGVQDVHVIEGESGFRVNRDIARGAAQWLTLHRYSQSSEGSHLDPTARGIDQLKKRGYQVVAVSGRDANGSLLDFEPTTPTALIFGNELDGVSATVLDRADEVRSLPMFGFTESFNLSVAVALSLAAFSPKIRRANLPWQLPANEAQELRENWIRQSLGHQVEKLDREYDRRFGSNA